MDAFLQCFEGHSRNLFPDTGSSLLGACTKEFTACGFTSFSICSFSFVVNLSAVISLSFCFRPNSAHQLGDCSVGTELVCRANRSKQEFCVRCIRIEVYGVSVLLSFQNSTTDSTDAFVSGWLVSLLRSTICVAVEFIFLQVKS